MGAISRKVFPVCESLCFFCPGLRARSRHPVKRYKKLISDVFPRSPDEEPNDRKIGKLCEYAARNPLRIPRITTSLEQRFYKDLRLEQFHSVKVVICVYKKLLISCKEQMPLFASSYLGIVQILLDQTRHDEVRILGCQALSDFVLNQTSGSYMFNLDGLIPKICPLAQEMGDEERTSRLRSAGLQALSSMVWFMGEFSHMSIEFDNVVSVVLENYGGLDKTADAVVHDKEDNQTVPADKEFSPLDAETRASSWRSIVDDRGNVIATEDDVKNPRFWSRVCLHNMAKLAKEATTVRRVLESLFRFFDSNELWSTEHGVALSVLEEMQLLIERSGQNTHFILSILIKHLDHKNVLKKPNLQLDIVFVATALARQTKVQPSVAIIGAQSDMIRHLRKSIHCSLDDSNLGAEMIQYNQNFQAAVDECLIQLSHKVGDAGPILDIMAVMLENMSNITVMARTLISAVYRTAQIIAPIPNTSYQNKAFPDVLFHQLLHAMVCTDHESRVGAHCIFSVVLVPSSICPQAIPNPSRPTDMQRMLSRTVTVFSSSAALFGKLKKEPITSLEETSDENAKISRVSTLDRSNSKFSRGFSIKAPQSGISTGESVADEEAKGQNSSVLNKLKSTYSRAYSVKGNPSSETEDQNSTGSFPEKPVVPLRLSSHQIMLLLSSIWVQSISPLNMPQNYEAIAHTYSLMLLFGRTKNSSNDVMIRSFQLAFSLRNISLGGPLQPSRGRSLFTLATSMIIFSSKAFNITRLLSSAKAALNEKTMDPFLLLVDDCKLDAINSELLDPEGKIYGSKEDDEDALKSLSAIKTTEHQSKECFATMILNVLGNISDQDSSSIREQLLADFIPNDSCPMGGQLMETPEQIYQSESKGNESPKNEEPLLLETDNNAVASGTSKDQTDHSTETGVEPTNLWSIDELLNAVSQETAQVRRYSVSDPPDMTYNEMASHCEALLRGKQQKMSTFMSGDQKSNNHSDAKEMPVQSPVEPVVCLSHLKLQSGNPFDDQNFESTPPALDNILVPGITEYQTHPHHFIPPASSPFDNFLKAASS